MSRKTTLWNRLAHAALCLALAAGLTAQTKRSDLMRQERVNRQTRSTHRIGGPVLDYVFDREAGLRPLLGIPGATSWGESVALPDMSAAVASAERRYALAVSGDDRRPSLVRNLSGPVAVLPLPDTAAGVDRMAVSPGGAVAALYYREAASIQVVGGLPDNPAARWTSDAGTLPGSLEAMAVSDNARAVLASAVDGDRRSLVRLTPDGDWRYLTSLDGSASIAFLNDSADAVIADNAANRVFLVRGTGEVLPLAGEPDGISRPVGVAASADNRSVAVANSDPGGVVLLSLRGGGVETVACRCVPTGLRRLSGNSVFRLNDPSDAQIYVFDGDSQQSRIVLVPPSAAARASEGGNQ